MIKINIPDEINLNEWYVGEMGKKILSKGLSTPKNSMLNTIYNKLSSLSKIVIYDILCLPIKELCQKYSWIDDYVNLCEFCSQYVELCEKYRFQHLKRYAQREKREKYFTNYRSNYINQLLIQEHATETDIYASWKKMDKFVSLSQKFLKEMNDSLISQKFSYDMIPAEIRGELVQRFNIPVCPYCNKQYIQIYEKQGTKRYLGDIDHFLAKSTYKLFSMSLWNLIPSCKSCNQTFKNVSNKKLLNPRFYGFDDAAGLILYYKDVRAMVGLNDNMDMKWEVDIHTPYDIKALIQNNIKLFCLDETYKYHKKDIKLALYKRFKYSKIYSKTLYHLLHAGSKDYSYEKIIYGVSLDKLKFQEEPLSKAIFDAVINN